jgi:hypothetical protein
VRVHGITVLDMRQNWRELNRIIERDGWQAMRQQAGQFQDRYFAATEREARAGAQLVL